MCANKKIQLASTLTDKSTVKKISGASKALLEVGKYRIPGILLSLLPLYASAISLSSDTSIGVLMVDANNKNLGRIVESNNGSNLNADAGGTRVKISEKTIAFTGTKGELTVERNNCFKNRTDPTKQTKCKLYDEFANIKYLDDIIHKTKIEFTSCGEVYEHIRLFNEPIDQKKLEEKISNYFGGDTACSDKHKKILAKKIVENLEKEKNNYENSFKVGAKEAAQKAWSEIDFMNTLMNPENTNRQLKLKIVCSSSEEHGTSKLTESTINLFPDNPDWISLLKSYHSYYDTAADQNSEIFRVKALIGQTHNTQAQAATTSVTQQNTTAIAAPAKATVAEIQDVVRTNSPNAGSLVSSFASEAADRAYRAISSVNPATLKAIGANPASILALSQAAHASTTRFEVTLPKSLTSTTNGKLAKSDNTANQKATTSATEDDSDEDAPKSTKTANTRAPASMKGGANLAATSTTDGTSAGLNIASGDGPSTSSMDKKTTMLNPKSLAGTDKTVVGELMDKRKSNEYLKILESKDEKTKPQRLALLARLKKDKIRIFDSKQNPLGYDKQDANYIFRQKDNYFERLK